MAIDRPLTTDELEPLSVSGLANLTAAQQALIQRLVKAGIWKER
jgi:hypothetical protein